MNPLVDDAGKKQFGDKKTQPTFFSRSRGTAKSGGRPELDFL